MLNSKPYIRTPEAARTYRQDNESAAAALAAARGGGPGAAAAVSREVGDRASS
jgi:hypothetical protein